VAGLNARLRGIGMTSERTRLRMVERLRECGVRDEVVLQAMADVPRHVFVEEALSSRAYDDDALPIGYSQTISAPSTVARMCEVLRNGRALDRVLEVGTGCGYQAMVLARLAREVYSIERIEPLLDRARVKLIRDLKVRNVRTRHGDGALGAADAAPFDGIIMAAAAREVPRELLGQLRVGGRMVLPVGGRSQHLRVVDRTPLGFSETQLEPVHFVPLLSGKV
jgi:protein-L-isoaspartate(D-aspartate) O-methyltransferase